MQNLATTEQIMTIANQGFHKPELEANSYTVGDLSAYNKQKLTGFEKGIAEIDGSSAAEYRLYIQTNPAGFRAVQTPLL